MVSKKRMIKQLEVYKIRLEQKGYKVVYIGLYGSQNYNLQDSKSDIDAKAIVVPNLKQIVFNETISKVEKFSEGQVDVKDIMTFYSVIKKGNFTYIECMHTDYWIGEQEIRNMFKDFEVSLMSMLGAMYEKRKNFLNPKTVEKGKNFHHLLRLHDLICDNIKKGKDFISFKKYPTTRPTQKLHRDCLIKNKRDDSVSLHKKKRIEKIIEVDEKKVKEFNQYFSIKNIDEIVLKYIESKLRKEMKENGA